MSEGKTKKSEFIRSNQLCAVLLVFINVQQCPLSHKSMQKHANKFLGEKYPALKKISLITYYAEKKVLHC